MEGAGFVPPNPRLHPCQKELECFLCHCTSELTHVFHTISVYGIIQDDRKMEGDVVSMSKKYSRKNKRLGRMKDEAKKRASRLRFWLGMFGGKLPSEGRETRLKYSGNPFRHRAEYRGNRAFRLDGEWWYKGPYRMSKDGWRAYALDREILKYRKGVAFD